METISPIPLRLPSLERSELDDHFILERSRPSPVRIGGYQYEVNAAMDVHEQCLQRADTVADFRSQQVMSTRPERLMVEFSNKHFRSAEDLRGKMNSWGFKSVKERDSMWRKMATIWSFLLQHNYVENKQPFQDFLPTSDSLFHIFSFICKNDMSKSIPLQLPDSHGNRGARRTQMIDFMLQLGKKFELTKPLRKTDLLNPVAKFSKPRVVDFLYHLTDHVQKAKDKGITLRRHQRFHVRKLVMS